MGSHSPPPITTTSVSSALQDALQRYTDRNPVSLSYHKNALSSLPGGNTRSVLHESPFPIHISRGERHLLHSVDRHTYIDLVGELTAGLFGHSHPLLLETLTSTARDVGLSLGATNVLEARYASLLCERFGLDRVRFTNSGTEANLHALAAARKFTGRRKVLVCTGGYHGGVLTFGVPIRHDEPGPGQDQSRSEPGGKKKRMAYGQAENNVDQDTFVLVEYNDCEGVVEAFRAQGEAGFAAALVESMQGSAGFIPATREFLVTIQQECAKSGAVFILDEIMTSRLAPGGMQSTFHDNATNNGSGSTATATTIAAAASIIKPGLTTFGKYLGGGMPFGAFGGSADIMAVYDPRDPTSLFHSGTFQNNTLMLAMGYAALSQIYTPEAAVAHSARGERLRAKLKEVTRGTKVSVTGVGSLMCLHFGKGWGRLGEAVRSKEHGGLEDEELKTLFWLEMLERGFWVQRRGSVALILDMPDEVDGLFVDAVRDFVARYSDHVRLKQ